MTNINKWVDSKPRERLVNFGAENLTDIELLAILLRTGGLKNQSVVELSQKILTTFGGLDGIKRGTLSEFQQIQGVGIIKAIELKAIVELSRRLSLSRQVKHGRILSSQDAGEMLMHQLSALEQEHVVVLFLNTKHDILSIKTIFIGSANRSIAEPRDILREAIRIGAVCIIVGHNHPSGHPEPSNEDVRFTKRLEQAGELVGITLVDHLVIGQQTYVSLKERGII